VGTPFGMSRPHSARTAFVRSKSKAPAFSSDSKAPFSTPTAGQVEVDGTGTGAEELQWSLPTVTGCGSTLALGLVIHAIHAIRRVASLPDAALVIYYIHRHHTSHTTHHTATGPRLLGTCWLSWCVKAKATSICDLTPAPAASAPAQANKAPPPERGPEPRRPRGRAGAPATRYPLPAPSRAPTSPPPPPPPTAAPPAARRARRRAPRPPTSPSPRRSSLNLSGLPALRAPLRLPVPALGNWQNEPTRSPVPVPSTRASTLLPYPKQNSHPPPPLAPLRCPFLKMCVKFAGNRKRTQNVTRYCKAPALQGTNAGWFCETPALQNEHTSKIPALLDKKLVAETKRRRDARDGEEGRVTN
jgi:hypothetical protein